MNDCRNEDRGAGFQTTLVPGSFAQGEKSKLAIMCDMLFLIRLFKESSLSNNLRVMTFRLLLMLKRVALW